MSDDAGDIIFALGEEIAEGAIVRHDAMQTGQVPPCSIHCDGTLLVHDPDRQPPITIHTIDGTGVSMQLNLAGYVLAPIVAFRARGIDVERLLRCPFPGAT